MNKDLVVASSIGFGLGLIAAIMLWVVPRIMPKNIIADKKSDVNVSESNPQATPSSNEMLTLDLVDGTVVDTTELTVKGKAVNSKLLIIATPEGFNVATPDESGNFSSDITLIKGANHIAVTNYIDTKPITQEVDIFYYPEKI